MESEDDFDIDDILQGLDLDTKGSTGQGAGAMSSAPKPAALPSKDIQKDILSMFQAEPNQKSTVKIQSAPAANKSVRFSANAESAGNPKAGQQQPPPPQSLSDVYNNNNPSDKGDQSKIQIPPSSATGGIRNPQNNPASRPTPKTSSNDWLGLGDETPVSTPPQQRPSFQQRNVPSQKQAVVFDSEDEISEDNDLMRTLGLKPLSSKSTAATANKTSVAPVGNPIPAARQTQPPKSASGLERPSAIFKTHQVSSPPISANYPASLTPTKSGPGSLEVTMPLTASSSNPSNVNKDPKLPPFPNTQQAQPVRTVFDSLPFLNTLPTSGPQITQQYQPEGPAPNSQGDNVQIANTVPSGQKKKTIKNSGAGNNNNVADPNTLTLPSHLIDQDQLKAMASSLKTLYETQMENLEKGYTEQIEFVHQSSRRKEELLKDEIKALQKNYDNRLERLKNDLQEAETKMPQKLQQELSTVMQQLTLASSTAKNENTENSNQFDKTSLLQEIEKSVENKLAIFAQQMEDIISKSVKGQNGNSNISKQMEQAFVKLQEITKMREEDVKKMHDKIDDSEVRLASNFRKLIREQQKMKEKIVKAAVTTISNEMNAVNQERSQRKEKTTSQVKEFHRDLRRLIYDLEVKNDNMHKSQLSIEMEQKNISQTIRDLNSFLHSSSNSTQQAMSSNPNISSQMSAMQAIQQQAQNEMEMKILREERNTLSESIAKIQVERHKLNEERVLLEKDKLEFEREKNRIRDLEVQLRVRISEAEEKIMHTETVRREETNKSKEAEAKMREMESTHMHIKDRLHTAEQKLQMREQKLYQDKTELIREKEFLDKLRDQLLCPGCLKSLTVPSSGSYVRSSGDGLDLSNLTKLQNPSTILNFTNDEPYFQMEAKFLDSLYDKQF